MPSVLFSLRLIRDRDLGERSPSPAQRPQLWAFAAAERGDEPVRTETQRAAVWVAEYAAQVVGALGAIRLRGAQADRLGAAARGPERRGARAGCRADRR